MFAANAKLDVGPRRAAAFDADRDKFADALLVDRHEGISGENSRSHVAAKKGTRVVARQGHAGLGQVIGAE